MTATTRSKDTILVSQSTASTITTTGTVKSENKTIKQTKPRYKLYVWDTGTTGTNPRHDRIHSFTISELYASKKTKTTGKATRPKTLTTLIHTSSSRKSLQALISFVSPSVSTSTSSPAPIPVLIAHNAAFDAAFLQSELDRHSMTLPADWRFACTYRSVDYERASMTALARRYGIPYDENLMHHSEHDVQLLRKIVTHMIQTDVISVNDIVQSGRKLEEMADLYYTSGKRDTPRKRNGNLYKLRRGGNEDDDDVSDSDVDGEGVFVTRTGKYCHIFADCEYLKSARAILMTNSPDTKLLACPKCKLRKPIPQPIINPSTIKTIPTLIKHQHQSQPLSTSINSKPKVQKAIVEKYVVTQYGKYYHQSESCRYLKRSKYISLTDAPGKSLLPCPLCMLTSRSKTVSKIEITEEEDTEKEEESEIIRLPKQEDMEQLRKEEQLNMVGPFVRTKTGKKFHLKGCPMVKKRDGTSEWVVHEWNKHELTPCRKCLSNLFVIW